ncbi:hypothetical protein Q5H92_06380 [Hymenobacter sp. M29]|uniref:Uncharacterized protein n=1 Tax=Hymenobacter mellowenesis TaxID=3063995 RepID=A0ABT9A9V7_9BACT|nr:hypothetical protein [Hymenobacter sp. M29]MDO7845975.1 hypothetical protein [Hymenobacter sp. M29]
MKVLLTKEEVEKLLFNLCVKLGFCLPLVAQRRIINSPPTNVDRFADVVYKAEGLDPKLASPLYNQVHKMVAEAFQQHEDSGES